MKRGLILLGLLALTLPCAAQWRSDAVVSYESETVSAMRAHVGYLSSAALEGRGAGTQGEKEAAQYVWDILDKYGLDMITPRDGDTFGVVQPGGDTLTSRNVAAVVQGYDKDLKNRYIVVGARLDNLPPGKITIDGLEHDRIYPGANGNSSGLAIMMELAKMVSTGSVLFRRSVIFVAFGASKEAMAGSWYFLNRSFPEVEAIDAMINLDMLGAGEEFYAFTASNADLDAVLSNLELPPLRPVLTTAEPYPSDYRSFYSKQIPSVFFTRGMYPQHDSPRDTEGILDYSEMELELETIYVFTRTVACADRAPDFVSEGKASHKDDRIYTYDEVDTRPSFMGSVNLKTFMEKWVYQYLKYPDEAVRAKVQGTVNVRFVVDASGNVTGAEVVKGVDESLDAEAVKVIKASPKWKPAKVHGKAVGCVITVPVEFRLSKKGKFDIKK